MTITDADLHGNGNAESNGAGTADELWPSLPGQLPAFPLDALPDDMRRWVEALAEQTQTPPDLAALAGLGVLSAAALGHARVDCGVWVEESLGLWLLVALKSGDRKSTVLRAASAPLRAIERELQEGSAQPMREQLRRREILRGQQQSQMKIAVSNTDPDARQLAEAELTRIDTELEEIGEPVKPRLLADDATPEALGRLLAKHGQISVVAAEAPLLDNLTGRYSDGSANLHLACSAYVGEPAQIDRTGRETELLERPLLAITLTVQPQVLERLVNHDVARRQGFVARFALVLPQSLQGRRRSNPQTVSPELQQAWAATVRSVIPPNLLTEPTELRRSDSSVSSVSNSLDADSDSLLLLSREASALLTELRDELEPRLADGGDLAGVDDFVARHPGRIARIAGLLHLAQGHSVTDVIDESTMLRALCIGEYLLAHCLAALTVHDEETRRHLQWLGSREEATVTVRDLHRGPLNSRGKSEEAKALATKLVALGALKARPAGEREPGQHPSPAYEINPGLRGLTTAQEQRDDWWMELEPPDDDPGPSLEDLTAALSINGSERAVQ